MPTYRFSWSPFDDRAVTAFTEACTGRRPSAAEAREWLAEYVKRPNDEFVRRTRLALQEVWLPGYPGVRDIARRLSEDGLGPGGTPRSNAEAVRYIVECRNTKNFRARLLEALIRFGDGDRPKEGSEGNGNGSGVPRFATLDPRQQPEDPRRPHPYQLEAWERLGAEAARAQGTGVFQGLLVMPTGSGKTFTVKRHQLPPPLRH